MSIIEIFRLITTILILAIAIFSLTKAHQYLRRDRTGRMIYMLPMMIYLVHIILYYSSVVFKYIYIGFELNLALSVWSVILRLHGVVSVTVMLYFLDKRNGKITSFAHYQEIVDPVAIFEKIINKAKKIDELV